MRLLLLIPLNPFLLRLDGLVLAQSLVYLGFQTSAFLTPHPRIRIVAQMCHLIQQSVQDDDLRRRTSSFGLINDAAVFFWS